MGLPKGKTNNIKGKPIGCTNKISYNLKETINDFLEKNFSKIENDFDKLQPRDRMKFYIDLLQYGVPKLQATEFIDNSWIEKLSDDELINLYNEFNLV